MTRIKAFVKDPGITETDKFRFLSNTPKSDAPRIMQTFRDVCVGLPQAYRGTTARELHEAGILGLYETQ